MKTQEEIQQKLEEIRRSSCLQHEPVTVEVNEVLALMQTHLEGKIDALKWVLDD